MKTKYMVYVMNKHNDMEVQTVVDTYEDATWYAEDNKTAGIQYVAKFTTMKVIK